MPTGTPNMDYLGFMKNIGGTPSPGLVLPPTGPYGGLSGASPMSGAGQVSQWPGAGYWPSQQPVSVPALNGSGLGFPDSLLGGMSNMTGGNMNPWIGLTGLLLGSMMMGDGKKPKGTKYSGSPNAGSLERAHWAPGGDQQAQQPDFLGSMLQMLPMFLAAL